jgi:hypothetical protein
MKDYRYRIEVGNEYTYRETGFEVDLLIGDLIDNIDGKLDALLAKAKGTEPPKKQRTARLGEIRITVEAYTPRPKEAKWRKVE